MDETPLMLSTTSRHLDDDEISDDLGMTSTTSGRVYYSMDDASSKKDLYFSCDEDQRPSSLLQRLNSDAPNSVFFLRATGILSPWSIKEQSTSCYHTLTTILYWIAHMINLVTLPYFFVVSVIYFITVDYGTIKKMFEYGVIIDGLLFLQVVVLIPYLYGSVEYLLAKSDSTTQPSHYSNQAFAYLVKSYEINSFKSLMWTCYLFFGVFFAMLLIDLVVKFTLSIQNLFRVNLLEYVSICAITATLLFVSVDCRVCYAVIDRLVQLVKAADANGRITINMSQLKESREEVDCRVQRHAQTITWIVVVAVLNIIYLLVVDIISTKWTAKELLELLPWKLASYFKEIAFLMVLFNESAKLNEKADELTQLIANHVVPGDGDGYVDDHAKISIESGSGTDFLHFQIRRLTLVNALVTKPISFPIAGRRWTKMDMLLQVMTVVVTTFIVVVRAIVIGNTT